MTKTTPAEAFSPGEYLRDELDERGWTVTEFAEILGRPVQAVSEILNSKKEITTDTAIELALALGTSPEMWLNLQTTYRLWLSRQRSLPTAKTAVERRARLRELVPLAEIRKLGWLDDPDDLDGLESSVCSLLEIETPNDTPSFVLAARRANASAPPTTEQQTWLARVRQLANHMTVDSFDPERLGEVAGSLAHRLATGEQGLIEVPRLLGDCGVAVVFLQGLRGGKIDGAATFIDGRAAIGLTTRYDRFDSLLFTLLHECAHLFLGHITAGTTAIIDDDLRGDQVDPREIQADDQAIRWTFPDGFEFPPSASAGEIVRSARRFKVHPSVIIGQVQRHTGRWEQHRTRIPKVRPTLEEAGLLS